MNSTLDVPGATLYYELRGSGPLVVLVAAPMDADSFAPLADLLAADYTVLTTDPRGINRSKVDDPGQDSTPELRADDLARLIEHVDLGAATVFGSSGGAVSVLALVQARPDLVHTAIAHEPPLHLVLPDHEELRVATEDMLEIYRSGDDFGTWKKFFEIANMHFPDELIREYFCGERTEQQRADEDFQNFHMLMPSVRFAPDIERLRSVPSRILIGIGAESAEQLCDRSSRALCALLGTEPTMFPGDHTGFAEDPVSFEPALRAVITR